MRELVLRVVLVWVACFSGELLHRYFIGGSAQVNRQQQLRGLGASPLQYTYPKWEEQTFSVLGSYLSGLASTPKHLQPFFPVWEPYGFRVLGSYLLSAEAGTYVGVCESSRRMILFAGRHAKRSIAVEADHASAQQLQQLVDSYSTITAKTSVFQLRTADLSSGNDASVIPAAGTREGGASSSGAVAASLASVLMDADFDSASNFLHLDCDGESAAASCPCTQRAENMWCMVND